MVFNRFKPSGEKHVAAGSFGNNVDPNNTEKNDFSSSSDIDRLSLEERNEKEIQLHPDQITSNAQDGVQKAEAAALVWPKSVVYATYAW